MFNCIHTSICYFNGFIQSNEGCLIEWEKNNKMNSGFPSILHTKPNISWKLKLLISQTTFLIEAELFLLMLVLLLFINGLHLNTEL